METAFVISSLGLLALGFILGLGIGYHVAYGYGYDDGWWDALEDKDDEEPTGV